MCPQSLAVHHPGKKRAGAAPGPREWQCCCLQHRCRPLQQTAGLRDAAGCTVFSLQLCGGGTESWPGRAPDHTAPENVELMIGFGGVGFGGIGRGGDSPENVELIGFGRALNNTAPENVELMIGFGGVGRGGDSPENVELIGFGRVGRGGGGDSGGGRARETVGPGGARVFPRLTERSDSHAALVELWDEDEDEDDGEDELVEHRGDSRRRNHGVRSWDAGYEYTNPVVDLVDERRFGGDTLQESGDRLALVEMCATVGASPV